MGNQKIENAKIDRLYNSINSMHHMNELPSRDYDFLYKYLKYRNSYHFVDKDLKYNLVMKIDSEKLIEAVVKNRKIINVTRDISGPIIEMNIEGFSKPFSFSFNLNDKEGQFNLNTLIKKREAQMHFVLFNGNKLVKIFSALLNIDDRILERLFYIIDLTYNGGYPTIEYKEEDSADVRCIELEEDEYILDEILNIIDNLQKWGSGDSFSILVRCNDTFKIIFKGYINNFNYIKNELQKKYQLLGESTSICDGIPFIKYDRGMIYFYKTRFSDDIEQL